MKETPTGLLAMDDVRCFLGDFLDAVSYMHSYGLVHRDIKPANSLLKAKLWEARPVLKLADFGLAAPCVQGGSLNERLGDGAVYVSRAASGLLQRVL